LSRVTRLAPSKPDRILDFDVETIASGFADPQWVPQRITAIAWSWLGDETAECHLRIHGADEMFSAFEAAWNEADMVTGHNVIRFDFGVLSADRIRRGLQPLKAVKVHDTMRLRGKSKGLKKGLDNLATMTKIPYRKLSLDWYEWENAYQWDDLIEGRKVDWAVVQERVVSDVLMHKSLYRELTKRGLLLPPTMWRP
jgi:hypothetical protein